MSVNVKMNQLTLDILSKYKSENTDMLPELLDYYNKNKHKFNRQHNNNWKKQHKNNQKHYDKKAAPLNPALKRPKKTDDEKLYSEFRGILNKITKTNFDSLSDNLVALEIMTKDHLSKLSELIFQKAVLDVEFSWLYGKLSKKLAGYYITEINEETNEEKKVYFREMLINTCQKTFNSFIIYDPESDEEIVKYKATGSMVFIGSLYNSEMLTNKIINSCFMLLLMKSFGGNEEGFLIDCISELMKSVGKIFTNRCPAESQVIFQKIDELIKSGKLGNRDRFALMDLIDLNKANKWA